MRKPIKIITERPTTRHGVPPQLAARYIERIPRPKKGAGSYTRKGPRDDES